MRAAIIRSATVAVGLALCACSGGSDDPMESGGAGGAADAANASRRTPDVILITFDTVRADHISCYGYGLPTSPNLDALAERADLYERSYSTAPWTLPSHASLFTGLLPHEHGARTFVNEAGEPRVARLMESHETLPELLSSAGYRTAAVASNTGYLSETFGLNQGFDVYQVQRVPGEKIARRATRWLKRLAPDEPCFLFVNLMDAHQPYNVRDPEGAPLNLPPASGKDSYGMLEQLTEHVLGNAGPTPDGLVDDLIRDYDRGIANADVALGTILSTLDELGRLEGAIVVVTSDHGEYFGEHGLVAHSKDVYDEAVRVPLVVKGPEQRTGRRLAVPVTGASVPRIIVDLLPDALAARGRELFGIAPGEQVVAQNYYTRGKDLLHPVWGERFRRERVALYEGDFKFIHSTDGSHELYNVADDPRELQNVRADQEAAVQRMVEEVLRLLQSTLAHDVPEADTSSDELQKELEALGYK